jgi:mRNA interferase RelE/StbE
MALLFAPDAFKDIQNSEIDRINRKINWLWVNRQLVKHEPLRWDLSGYFKRRLGNYRIIYTYDEASDEMVIHLVGLRDSIYQDIHQ